MLDEAHERTKDLDVTFGLFKKFMLGREDVRLIVASATIDAEEYIRFFNAAEVACSEHFHPIAIEYTPYPLNRRYYMATLDKVKQVLLHKLGRVEKSETVLVFLADTQQVRSAEFTFKQEFAQREDVEVAGLFGALPHEEQAQIMKCGKLCVKVVFTTNVAETAITFENVSTIIDAGLEKIQRYNTQTGISELEYRRISKNSAAQRAGRTGRQGPGTCYRMYTEDEFARMERRKPPAIMLQSIGLLLLWLLDHGVDDLEEIELIDKPDKEVLQETYGSLEEIGCIRVVEGKRSLSKLGKAVSNLGLEPCMGGLVYYSAKYKCTKEIMQILSVMQVNMPLIYTAMHDNEKLKKAYSEVMGGAPVVKEELATVQKTANELEDKLEKLFKLRYYIYNPKLLILGDLMFSLFVFRQFANLQCSSHMKAGGRKSFCRDCREVQYQWCMKFNVKYKTLNVAFRNYRDISGSYKRYCHHSHVSSLVSKELRISEKLVADLASILIQIKAKNKVDFDYYKKYFGEIEKPKKVLKGVIESYRNMVYEKITPVLLKVYGKQVAVSLNNKYECKRRVVKKFANRIIESEEVINKALKKSKSDREYLNNLALHTNYINIDSKISCKIHESSVYCALRYFAKENYAYERKVRNLSMKHKFAAVFPPQYILFTEQFSSLGRTLMSIHKLDKDFVEVNCPGETRLKIGQIIEVKDSICEYLYLNIGPLLLKELMSPLCSNVLLNVIRPVVMVPYYRKSRLGIICARESKHEAQSLMSKLILQSLARINAVCSYRESYWQTGLYVELGLGGNVDHVTGDCETMKLGIEGEVGVEDRNELLRLLSRAGVKFVNASRSYGRDGWVVHFKSKSQFDLCLSAAESMKYSFVKVQSVMDEFMAPHADYLVRVNLGYSIDELTLKEELEQYYGSVHKITFLGSNNSEAFISFVDNATAKKLIKETIRGEDTFKALSAREALRLYSIRVPYELMQSGEILDSLKKEIERLNNLYACQYVVLGTNQNCVKVFSDSGEILHSALYLVQPELFPLSRFVVNSLETPDGLFEGLGFKDYCLRNRAVAVLVMGASLVKIYGMPRNRLKCKVALLKYVSSKMEHSMHECVDLSGYPRKYARTYFDFVQYNWRMVESFFDQEANQILLNGGAHEVKQITEFIKKALKSQILDNGSESAVRTIRYHKCKICLSKKRSPEKYVILGLCGHKFCKWCLKMQISSALRNHPNADLPLVCAECKECLPPQAWESCGALRSYYKLLYAAMKHWKLKHPQTQVEWCENPKCRGVYCKDLLYSDQLSRYCPTCRKALCLVCGLDVRVG